MSLLNVVTNHFKAAVGRNQEFRELIRSKDISRAISQMENRDALALQALSEYETETHDVINRPDKVIVNGKGDRIGTETKWKIPVPYQVYINEIALVFLYGRHVKWTQLSTGTDKAFQKYIEVLERVRFNSKIREFKRIAGSETQSALLFHVFRNDEGQPDVQLRVLAKSKGDDIRVRWDQYENMIDAGWGYYVKEEGKTVYHFDIFTSDIIYRCRRMNMGWEVMEEDNLIGKIPIILSQQDKEWKGVERMINRQEYVLSRHADSNDYTCDPVTLMMHEILKGMPKKHDENKIVLVKGVDDVRKAVAYLTHDQAPESKKLEIDNLEKHILSKTFTPNIDFENMKSLSNVSAKALKQMMVLADIKASKHKEKHDELLSRTGKLITAIIGNVLDVSLKVECDNLKLGHEFQEPFGEDLVEAVKLLIDSKDAGLMSEETGVEQHPLIKDPKKEKERLRKERDEKTERFRTENIFEGAEV